VILTDAGPLIALIDRRDAEHSRCVSAAERLVGPMLSTWPAFTEAMYLLGSGAGWRGQEPLWRMVRAGQLILTEMNASMLARMPALMEQYSDLPMDLADASLVALAEERHLRDVFTLDHDFRVYRLRDGHAFSLLP
jgi:predicted nucleic acid-binding protein